MGIFSSTRLEKATIRSYETSERNGNFSEYEFMFNPESYSWSFQNNFDMAQGVGSTSSPAEFRHSEPETLRFKIIIDATEVAGEGFALPQAIPLFEKDSYRVVEDIDFFRKHIMGYDGNIHEPRYLIISWGALIFPCRLKSVQINYTLFAKSGIPLRAELDADFFYNRAEEIQEAINNKNSPDLTHVRIVKAHDRLPLMCEDIYGASQYYVYVAKANNLDDFRNLKPGQEIYFPPIEK